MLATEQEILDAIDRYYGEAREGQRRDRGPRWRSRQEDLEHLRDMASEAPVIRLVNAMIAQAVEKRASDIHIEPFEKEFRVRYRIDGVLYQPGPAAARIESRHHFAREADGQTEHRRAPAAAGRPHQDQDRWAAKWICASRRCPRCMAKASSCACSTARPAISTICKTSASMSTCSARMEHYTSLPHGIFLVTGPTGSGKSTTLYSALKRINQTDKKIITIEDPVEYQMDGINQIHVNPQIGLTFASGLRHIVRQDPDVIMVGEIRDRETADVAIRAALTGHFVYSTLHTNDAPSAITRLTDMGVENYLITSSVVAVLAQRLVRVICPNAEPSAGTRMTPDGETVQCFPRRGLRDAASVPATKAASASSK